MGRRLDAKASASLVVAAMEASGLRRGYLVFDPVSRRMRPSHSMFQPLADEVSSNGRDFNGHEAVFWQSYESTLLTATIHKTLRGQAAGGVRKWEYSSLLSAIEDGMRLSQGMGRKNSLAGLWWGGGKGVILSEPGLERKDLYRAYGQFVSSLNGAYVTAEDAGSTPADISEVFRTTRFTTCIPTELGGSGNPSVTTATGVVCGMEAGAFHVDGSGLEGKTVAVQGCGNVARYMFADLLKRGVGKIVATDISSEAVTATRELIGNDSRLTMKVVEPNDNSVLFEDADIVSPCALGGVLNALTIPNIKAKIVCGAANNQLLDESTDDKLLLMYEKVYVPDFLASKFVSD